MRKLLRKIFKPFFVRLADRFSAAPRKPVVFRSLSRLYRSIITKNKKGIVLHITDADRLVIFSDQHKGARDHADDFTTNEACYCRALGYYLQEDFTFINLGDAEELLKYSIADVLPKNDRALKAEAAFHQKNKYYRVFGNHDIAWQNKLDVSAHLEKIFTAPLKVYEGLVLRMKIKETLLDIFLTHGHQGDTMSDANPMSGWLLANIWAPIQRFLEININTPSVDPGLRNKHNRMMYEWSSQRKHLLLITGHTHKPVFASGRYASLHEHKIDTGITAPVIRPTYFNTGCCCYYDGDITGIEITGGLIRLVKWDNDNNSSFVRKILEENSLVALMEDTND